MFFTAILAFTLRFLLVWDNKRLERKQQKTDQINTAAAENYGPAFRYAL
jgi:hypothetical protein